MEASALVHAFDAFFLNYRVHAELPALMRMAVAAVCLGTFVLDREDLWELLRPSGVFPAERYADACRECPQISAFALFPKSERWAATVFALTFVAGFFALIGLWTRPAMWALLIGMTSVQSRTFIASFSGGDSVLRCVVFFLACTDTSSALALDALGREGRPAMVEGWGLRNIQVLVCAAYFWSALHKLHCPFWLDGSVIRNALRSHVMGRFPDTPLARAPRLLRAATYGTLVFEFFAPIGFYVRPFDAIFLAAGVAFHVGTTAVLTIGNFGPAMLVAVASFAEPLVAWAITPIGP
jgi:uncharacterized membrane protein YphA (DoxX/SURF4 family)